MPGIDAEIKELIATIIEKDASQIDPEARFIEDLGVDSMMALEFLAAIEKKYKIVIPEERLPEFITLNATIKISKEYLDNKK